MTQLSRRGFLAATAAFAALPLVPARARAAADTFSLTATTRVIEVNGRAATVMGLLDAQGRSGLRLDPGQRFRTDLTNALDIDTIVHWHGQIPPNAQDGVPNTNPMLKPGQSRSFDFEARPGTFWMHSHIPDQEIGLLAAPLIVRRPEDLAEDRQEVVMLLHDFAFATPQEVLETVSGGTATDHGAMDHSAAPMQGMDGMGDMMSLPGMAEMHAAMEGGISMDLNDYEFDAYLANDRTLADPEVVRVENGGRLRLRVIDGASMTAFWIDTGAAAARLVAVDGNPVVPLPGTRFAISPGQRLDLEIDLPGDGTAVPILALREGTRERTGLILAPKGAAVPKLADVSDEPHPAVSGDMVQEMALRAVTPLAPRPATAQPMVMLTGSMLPYQWTIDGRSWDNRRPIGAKSGERVEMMFHNMSMMAHPMHLHGHVFQVVAVNGTRIAGALRDTVSVPPMGSVTVALDAGEAAPWMLHCHHMGHLATGMMTEFVVSA
ncbi:multicopper oxidase family protein [Rhodobacter capsulatus]|uniref:multicopper oxidase family protein n=1 Tax=Rhodobacter capsulatus TaxID=1061 RepID=UPI0003D2D739|nr:multicopper oxidase family protein [Rhodobacter capsulatus]ETD83993.1 copper oxidase [Rhodobacter capsulatus YW1]